jgi:HK97 family phage prohead protease
VSSPLGELGEIERRTVRLERGKVTASGDGSGRLKVVGHASVYNSPSVEMRSRLGSFVEYISPGAFDDVLSRSPSVVFNWDHDSRWPLASTDAGTLELRATDTGLRYYASVTPTSYAEDLRSLMADGVVRGSSFSFTVAKNGEEWTSDGDRVLRTITRVQDLYDVCVCVSPAYPDADAALVRSLALDYAIERGFLRNNPDAELRAAKLRANLELRRRRLSV